MSFEPNRLNVFAIVKAVVITVVLFFAIGMALGLSIYVLVVLVEFDVQPDGMIEESMLFQAFSYCISLLPYVLGGYLAAAFAERNFLLHGFVTGTVLFAITGVFCLFPDEDSFKWSDCIILLLSIPLAAVGGFIEQIRVKQIKEKQGVGDCF